MIKEFNGHDPNSQAARYPVDRKENPTLISLEVIDLITVRKGVHKISHYLDATLEQMHDQPEWTAEIIY